MSKHIVVACALAALGSIAAFAHATTGSSLPPVPSSTAIATATAPSRAAPISLQCSGSGSSDVVSRHHSIRNTTGYTVPKGTRVYWKASDGGTGSLLLSSNLAPNATVDVSQPGQTNGYSCTSYFYAGPADLTVVSVAWTSATTATVQIKNLAPWTDAAATKVQVSALQCGTGTQFGLAVADVPAIPRLQTRTISINIAKGSADFLLATANSTHSIAESNFDNNTQRSAEYGNNKSCTPQ